MKRLNEIIQRVNDLFEGDLTDQDKTHHRTQDLGLEIGRVGELLLLEAHTVMSTQALNSESVRDGLKDVLLGPARLYETLRERATADGLSEK